MSQELECSHLTGKLGVTEKIKQAMYKIANEFVYIGFLLWEVKEYHYYLEEGYTDVYDYAQQELGFKKTSVKNFIAITEVFGRQEEMVSTQSGNFHGTGVYYPSMRIQQEYENFKYSQLCEMLSMSDKQRELVTPDMTIKEIRSLKQQELPQEATSESADPGRTSDQEIDFKTLDKVIAIAKSQTSDQNKITCTYSTQPMVVNNKYLLNKALQENYKGVAINNSWLDIREDILIELVRAAGLKKTKNMCYDIEIKVHKD